MNAFRLRNGLALRIIAPFAVALVVVFSLAAFLLGRTVRDEGLRELKERAQLLADTLAYNAELPLLASDVDSLEALLGGAARDSDLLHVAALDARGREVASFSPPGRPAALAAGRRPSFVILESPVMTVPRPAEGGEATAFALDPAVSARAQPIGRLRLLVSTERTTARTRRLQAQIAAAGLVVLALCVGIGFALVRALAGRLQSLVEATRRVAAGDLSVRVEPSTPDEIGELARAFNRMTADLDVARAEVLAERADLERRVAVLTAELERAQENLIH
jgi:HAMP domain-containing protein